MEKIINLESRGCVNYLKRLDSADKSESTTYTLKVEHPNLFVQTNEQNKIVSIDPMGGPKIEVGEKIEGNTVKSIDYILSYGYTITFEK